MEPDIIRRRDVSHSYRPLYLSLSISLRMERIATAREWHRSPSVWLVFTYPQCAIRLRRWKSALWKYCFAETLAASRNSAIILLATAFLATNSSKVIPVVALETKSAGPVKPPFFGYSTSHALSCASVGQMNVAA